MKVKYGWGKDNFQWTALVQEAPITFIIWINIQGLVLWLKEGHAEEIRFWSCTVSNSHLFINSFIRVRSNSCVKIILSVIVACLIFMLWFHFLRAGGFSLKIGLQQISIIWGNNFVPNWALVELVTRSQGHHHIFIMFTWTHDGKSQQVLNLDVVVLTILREIRRYNARLVHAVTYMYQ